MNGKKTYTHTELTRAHTNTHTHTKMTAGHHKKTHIQQTKHHTRTASFSHSVAIYFLSVIHKLTLKN